MLWDPTITLGTLINILAMVVLAFAGYYAFKAKIESFEIVLKNHADGLETHSERLDRHEDRILDLVGNLQRVVGRLEERQK